MPGERGLDAMQGALDGSPRVLAAQRRADGMAQRALSRDAIAAPRIQRHTGGPVVQRFPFGLARGAAKTAATGAGAWGGAQVGAALGSWLGPLGALAGGVVGGLAGGLAGYAASGAAIETFRVPRLESDLRAITGRAAPTHGGWQAYTDRQTRDLDALEHEAYAWLDENRLNPGAKPFMPRVLDLLDRVQTEHQAVIGEVHQRNLDLWTPDRDALGTTEAAKLQQAWTALRNGTGRVRTQGAATAGGQDLLRASHARLLSRPTGRRLLYTLLDMEGPARNRSVTVGFTPPDTRSTQDKRDLTAARARLRTIQARVLKLPPGPARSELIYGDQAQAQIAVQELSGSDSAAKAGAVDRSNANIFGPRGGSDSTVGVRQGTRDSDDLTYDWFGRATPAPAWLQYGHELIHALHNRNAEDRSAEDVDSYRGGRWSDREEYQTIKGLTRGAISENALRAEHGITGRFGHTGTTRDEWEGR